MRPWTPRAWRSLILAAKPLFSLDINTENDPSNLFMPVLSFPVLNLFLSLYPLLLPLCIVDNLFCSLLSNEWFESFSSFSSYCSVACSTLLGSSISSLVNGNCFRQLFSPHHSFLQREERISLLLLSRPSHSVASCRCPTTYYVTLLSNAWWVLMILRRNCCCVFFSPRRH